MGSSMCFFTGNTCCGSPIHQGAHSDQDCPSSALHIVCVAFVWRSVVLFVLQAVTCNPKLAKIATEYHQQYRQVYCFNKINNGLRMRQSCDLCPPHIPEDREPPPCFTLQPTAWKSRPPPHTAVHSISRGQARPGPACLIVWENMSDYLKQYTVHQYCNLNFHWN